MREKHESMHGCGYDSLSSAIVAGYGTKPSFPTPQLNDVFGRE